MKTCAEAILIEVVPAEDDKSQSAMIRASLTPEDFERIVFTWAQELHFEQACTDKVLRQIFAEFDIDGDGLISEADLVVKIERLIFGAPLGQDDTFDEAE